VPEPLDIQARLEEVVGTEFPIEIGEGIVGDGQSTSSVPKPKTSGHKPEKTLDLTPGVDPLLGKVGPHVLTAKERFAVIAAYTLGGFILGVSLILLWMHAVAMPHAPSLDGIKPDDPSVKATIENYRQLSEIADRSLSTTFDLLITRPLLPLLGALVGYILGQSKTKTPG
jgi:hypothetical protein